MSEKARLIPNADQTFRIVAAEDPHGEYDFEAVIEKSRLQESGGDIEGACNTRYLAFQRIYDLLPEGEESLLDWYDDNSRAAVMIINLSAIDHFLIGDWDMAAGMHELVLEIDPEDHLEATTRLAYTYIALGEFELFDEIANDISDKYADKQVLLLWSEQRKNGSFPEGVLRRFKTRFAPYFNEFTADEHPVSEDYLTEIDSEKPSQEALARELWLQTEPLWIMFPDFIAELRNSKP